MVRETEAVLGERAVGPPLLEVDGLQVNFYTMRGVVRAVQDVSLRISPRETLGLVGESGSGKSVTARALMDIVTSPGRVDGGEIRWRGEPVERRSLRQLRGKRISMIFQDPQVSLNPLMTVGAQITEVLRKHKDMKRDAANRRAMELLDLVGIPNPVQRFKQYPYEMSGGMAQRVMIAMALAPEPDLLIADEPTTALDMTIQAQILELIAELQNELHIAMLLITHDLGVVAGVCDRVNVMYAGRIVETGTADEIFVHPSHPYTAGLLESTPRLDLPVEELTPISGNPPAVAEVVSGCAFAPRCRFATERCVEERPALSEPPDPGSDDRKVACWHAL